VTPETGAPRTLTDRQIEILVHVARGRTNRQVGQALGISERTVRNHLRTISHKLSASDRTHAVVLAIEHGWIAIPIEPEEPASQESTAARQRVSSSGKR
jgi:DNA-binding NarL/FixJ family response regulator